MILITANSTCFSKTTQNIFCKESEYIESIEYINNKINEIILKDIISKDEFIYCNLRGEFHNPIGPAYIFNSYKEYWIAGKQYELEHYQKVVKKLYK